MPAKRKWTEDQLAHMKELFHSDLTNKEVGKIFACDFNKSIKKFWVEWFGESAVHDRFRKSCARSKTGELNPMSGNTKDKHHRYVERYVTKQGYVWVDAPDWFEGSRRGLKALEHNVVGCKKYGITRVPKGSVIHHIDEDKTNNDPDNLELMTISEHMRHHMNWHR